MTAKAKRGTQLGDVSLTRADLKWAAENQAHLISLGMFREEEVRPPAPIDWPLRDDPPDDLVFTWDQSVEHDKAA